MTIARQVLPGRVLFITRRCLERRYFLQPSSREAVELVEYLLAVGAAKFGMELVAVCAMSNHIHLLLHDRDGRHPEFTHWFDGLLARAMNCHRARTDAFWSAEQVNVAELADPDAVLDKIAYTLANPVKDGAVERGRQWPGVRSAPQACLAAPKVVRRPRFFFRRGSDAVLPEEAELCFHVPPTHADLAPRRFAALVAEHVAAAEAAARRDHAARGRRFLGVRRVRQRRWYERAKTSEAHGARDVRRPHVIARDRWARRAALSNLLHFREAYAAARARWLANDRKVIFPPGTWHVVVYQGARCHPPP